MNDRPDLAIMMFDYVPSGVVRNALRIAGAAHKAGIPTEIWTAQRVGEMADDIPAGVKARSFDLDLGKIYSPRDRKRAMACISKPLAEMLEQVRPRILLSAGNHFHKPAVAAVNKLAESDAPFLLGRISNALPRFSWWPAKLPNSILKRVRARMRYQAMRRLIAVSADVRHDLQTKLLINPSKITIIPNGIDIAEVELLGREPLTHPWFDAGQPPVLIGAGRLTHQKGFDLLLRAFANARASRPMRLIILGEGPQKGRLTALIKHLGIESDVELAGHVGNPIPYFRKAALFILPSRWEGFSNALLEAFASGTPIVASRCPGSAELLDKGQYGALVDVGDVKALTKGILELLAHKPSRTDQLKRAKDYDLARTLSAYVDLFRDELMQAKKQNEA